ncbi:MAG: DUF488 domain-containing protein [Gracilimonas sp.]|uniref:DUF488 domain-containing protein n=1 Tax=Gracilimonas sp. TaxID=1974203 RepID=UPI003752DF5D|nr:DUF488 domain-containing protein [Gracilimonas sp.]
MAVKSIQIKRIYEDASEKDGYRVLVDRLWPRGVSKEAAQLDEWNKKISPSPELRKWFDHDPEKFEEFKKRYKTELADREDVIDELFENADDHKLTLLYAAKDETHNHAIVLKEFLNELI